MDHADGYAVGHMAAGQPVGHLHQKAYGFLIEGFMASPYDLYMGDIAVGVHYEATGHTPFDATLVGVGRIVTVFVDVVEEGFVASGEGWFHFHIIVFKDFTVGLATVGGMA